MSLSRIEVITGMSKFSSLKAALSKAGVRGMTVMQVLGCGVEKGTREYEVDELEEMELLPKQQINIVVETERVNSIVEIITLEMERSLSINWIMASASAPVMRAKKRCRGWGSVYGRKEVRTQKCYFCFCRTCHCNELSGFTRTGRRDDRRDLYFCHGNCLSV